MRTVVITGGTAGIGRAAARRFAEKGWRVAVMAREPHRLEQTKRDLESRGARALAVEGDVADPRAHDRLANVVFQDGGGIDVWINNAMTTVYSPVWEMTPEEFARVTDVVYHGQVHGTMTALKHMRPKNAGTIVQIGSALAHRSIPLQSAYCGAKFAVRGFTDSLRAELEHEGSKVRLTMVQLPGVNTPQFSWCRSKLDHEPQPPDPVFSPDAVARAIYDAAMSAPRELYVARSALQLIAGQAVAPGVMDHAVGKLAWEGQMQDEPQPATRKGNLFEPVPGEWAAEGEFSDRQEGWAAEINPAAVRAGLAAALGGIAIGLGYLATRDRDRPRYS